MAETSTSDMAARIQALEDIAAIKDVQYAYWRSIDLKQPNDFRDIFASGEISIAFPGAPVMRDREELISMVTQHGMSPAYQGNHFGLSPRIRLTGPESASGNWRVQMIGYDFDQRTATRMTAAYDCEYARTNDGWRISSMVVQQQSMFIESVAGGGELKATTFGPVAAEVSAAS
jgi:hypothetical protein